MVATRCASSTVDAPQSASNEIFTPSPRKAAVGKAQRGFPRAGGRGVGAGKKEVDGSDESLLSEETLAEAAWPRAQLADGGRHGWRALW